MNYMEFMPRLNETFKNKTRISYIKNEFLADAAIAAASVVVVFRSTFAVLTENCKYRTIPDVCCVFSLLLSLL